ncbi:hypothetical protein ACH5RR_040902 [Cinchona calisaya]|uniref:DUF4283 domain-containing protein n=1 Tax=Cinchona calisaya TaxID=153742 RepID=A0ABD2XVG6_9GENT
MVLHIGAVLLESDLRYSTHSTFNSQRRTTVFFTSEQVQKLAKALRYALVGKFSMRRLSMATLKHEFLKFEFVASLKQGFLDNRHILVRFDLEEEYLRYWCRGFYSILWFVMRILKWIIDFTINPESLIVSVQINLTDLPFHLFHKAALFSITIFVGNPLKIDSTTIEGSHPRVARVCIELDLTKP